MATSKDKKNSTTRTRRLRPHHRAIRDALSVLSAEVPGLSAGNKEDALSERVHLIDELTFGSDTFPEGTCGKVLSVSELPSGLLYEVKLDGDSMKSRFIFEDDLAAGCPE